MSLKTAIDTARPGQRLAIDNLSGPLIISAGAGTGKTHTLTWRIVHALASDADKTPQDVGEMLIITFTRKAAGELIARIRKALKEEGLREDALLIDGAWISTIHAMCLRILKQHALLIGLDPFFTQIEEDKAQTLLTAAYENVLLEAQEDERFTGLLNEYRPDTLCELVTEARAKYAFTPQGEGSTCFGPPPRAVCEMVRDFEVSCETIAECYRGFTGNVSRTSKTLPDAMEKMEKLLAGFGDVYKALEESEQEGIAAVFSLLSAYPQTRKSGSAELKALIEDEHETRHYFCAELACRHSYDAQTAIFELAKLLDKEYNRAKRAINVIDSDDLLIMTHDLLVTYPDVAEKYHELFKLVMVDEFQDTDQLQIDMIQAICGEEGRTLCTVGDEQQSIYGFRGADVAVYRKHKYDVRALPFYKEGQNEVQLEENFRSHPDILAAVNTLFSQSQTFGEKCLRLIPGRDEEKVKPAYKGKVPRVRLLVCHSDSGGTAQMREFEAKKIAEQFKGLLDQGFKAGDMAILLGKMTNADVFARAIEAEGMECSAAGGSTFYKKSEVTLLVSLLRAVANPHDEEAFAATLASPLFDLSDDGLLKLKNTKQSLSATSGSSDLFDALCSYIDTDDELGKAAQRFTALISLAQTAAVSRMLSFAVEGSVWETVLLSQGVSGNVVYANIVKFIDLVRIAEQAPDMTLSKIMMRFRGAVQQGDKQRSGEFVSDSGEAVSILTVHGSKGLEYPIVAVADFFEDNDYRTENLLTVSEDKITHAGLLPSGDYYKENICNMKDVGSLIKEESCCSCSDDVIIDESSPLSHITSLRQRCQLAAKEERQRLYYVACTRAREVLILAGTKQGSGLSSDNLKGCFADTASAFFEDRGFPELRKTMFSLGESGGEGLYEHYSFKKNERTNLMEPVLTEEECEAARNAKVIVKIERPASDVMSDIPPRPYRVCAIQEQRKQYSYSALAPYSKHHVDFETITSLLEPMVLEEGLVGSEDGTEREEAEYLAPANDFGSAFHLLAQIMAEKADLKRSDREPIGELDQERLQVISQRFKLSEEQRARLACAVKLWSRSEIGAQAYSFSCIQAEMPFNIAIPVDEEDGFFLEGSIDLYCSEPAGGKVLIVDYKTGNTEAQLDEGGLEGRYRFQAECYSYAALVSGAQEVEVVYVRPEVELEGQPQTVRPFSKPITQADKDSLEQEIRETYLKAKNSR